MIITIWQNIKMMLMIIMLLPTIMTIMQDFRRCTVCITTNNRPLRGPTNSCLTTFDHTTVGTVGTVLGHIEAR